MQLLTVQITHNSALKALQDLEQKHFIRIVEESDINSSTLPGQAMNVKEFQNWISEAENTPTVDLKEARSKWAGKRKQLEKSIR